MKAQDIKAGAKFTIYDDATVGRVIGGWRATGDAVVSGHEVYIPVRYFDGGDGTRIFDLDVEVLVEVG